MCVCVCMTTAVLREVCEVGTVCVCVIYICVHVCVLEGLSGEINRLGPLSCFHEVLLI